MEDSLIRFACVTSPGEDSSTSFPYLEAIAATGLGVRIMPLGAMHFGIEPWNRVSPLFLTALKTRFINVVCVEPGTKLGERFQATRIVMTPQGPMNDTPEDAAVYEPPMAISGLYTVGIPNIAILSGKITPEGKELETLKRYDTVICPDIQASLALDKQGVKSAVISPEPDQLSRVFSGMTPV